MEGENISQLIERVESSLLSLSFELIVVDDNSPDGTSEVAEDLNTRYGNIRVLKRAGKLGLGSAVLEGFERAEAEVLAVLDGDLQHPPEILPLMYSKIREGYDLVVASRYVGGGKTIGWSLRRKIASKGGAILAHLLIPRTREVKDVMSGFFMLRKGIVEGVNLNPIGYKILLEILAKGSHNSLSEMPYAFEARKKGRSNLTFREVWNYLVHIYRLL